jgi:hypothetical protein
MTNVRNPFTAPIGVDARLLMEDWRHTSEVTSISGTRILDLFAVWTGEAGLTGEIMRLGWLYTRNRDQAEVIREQLVDAGYLPA